MLHFSYVSDHPSELLRRVTEPVFERVLASFRLVSNIFLGILQLFSAPDGTWRSSSSRGGWAARCWRWCTRRGARRSSWSSCSSRGWWSTAASTQSSPTSSTWACPAPTPAAVSVCVCWTLVFQKGPQNKRQWWPVIFKTYGMGKGLE